MDVQAVLVQLASADKALRYAAVIALETWQPPPLEAIPALVAALADGDFVVTNQSEDWEDHDYIRQHAAVALRRLRVEAVPQLREALAFTDRWYAAAEILGTLKAEDLRRVPATERTAVLAALQQRDPAAEFTRSWAFECEALDTHMDERVRIERDLQHPDRQRRAQAVLSLARLEGVQVDDLLANVVATDQDWEVYGAAVRALSERPLGLSDKALRALGQVLFDTYRQGVWADLISLLCRYGGRVQEILPRLCDIALQSDWPVPVSPEYQGKVRRAAASALHTFSPSGLPCMEALLQRFLTGDDQERKLVVLALGCEVLAPAVLPTLLGNLAAHPIDVADRLDDLGPQAAPALPYLLPYLEPQQPTRVVMRVASVIGHLQEAARPALPALVELVRHPQHREWACYALRNLGEVAVDVLPQLEPMAEDFHVRALLGRR